MSYELIWEPRGVVKRFSGVMNRRDLVEPVERIQGDPRFDDLRWAINDTLGVERVEVSMDDVDYVAALDRAGVLTNPNIRIAIVTTLPEILGIATSYSNLSGQAYPTRVFETLEAARRWAQE